MSAPTVSVLMPAYNGEKYIGQAIESVLSQSFSDLELIVVDDGSVDDTMAIVERYMSDSRLVCLESVGNKGVAAARNRALSHSNGRFISFLDQDDAWLPNKLEVQVKILEDNPDVAMVHSDVMVMDEVGFVVNRDDYLVSMDSVINVRNIFPELFARCDIQVLTVLLRKSVLDNTGWFNEELAGVDDYELWLRIAKRYSVAHIKTALAMYRKHPQQESNNGYKQLSLRLRALETFVGANSEVRNMIGGSLYVHRMKGLYIGVANYYFWVQQDYKSAKFYYWKGLRLKPLDFGIAMKLIYCMIPELGRNIFRWLKK